MILVVGVAGICGNISAIVVFSKRRHQRNFHTFMLCLAIVDLLCIIELFLLVSLPQLLHAYKTSGAYYYVTPWVVPFAQVSIAGSIYLTIAVTMERYLTVCHPFYMYTRRCQANLVIALITVFVVVYNIPKFFEFRMHLELELEAYSKDNLTQSCNGSEVTWNITRKTVDDEKCNSEWVLHSTKDYNIENSTSVNKTATAFSDTLPSYKYTFTPTQLRQNVYYWQFYAVYGNVFVNGVVPFTLLIVLNLLIIRGLHVIESESIQDSAVPLNSIRRNSTVQSEFDQNLKIKTTVVNCFIDNISIPR